MGTIYLLIDPRLPRIDKNCIRYVGQTKDPRGRASDYQKIQVGRPTNPLRHVDRWINEVIRSGHMPIFEVLWEGTASPEQLDIRERMAIKTLFEEGCPLTNKTAGGQGNRTVLEKTPAQRAAVQRMIERNRGRPRTERESDQLKRLNTSEKHLRRLEANRRLIGLAAKLRKATKKP